MRVGTTPTQTFTFPFNTSDIDSMHIIYSQDGEVKLIKTKDDCVFKDNVAKLTLSQEDTFLFKSKAFVDIQVRVLVGDSAMASNVMKRYVDVCLENEVLT